MCSNGRTFVNVLQTKPRKITVHIKHGKEAHKTKQHIEVVTQNINPRRNCVSCS